MTHIRAGMRLRARRQMYHVDDGEVVTVGEYQLDGWPLIRADGTVIPSWPALELREGFTPEDK